MNVPFIDLKTQYQSIKNDIDIAIARVLEHGKYINGPEVAELESVLADYVGVEHVVGCSNGTDALLMSLMATDIGPGDLVFTTPFTFIATAEVISLVGARPVFVDVNEKTFNIDPVCLVDVIEKTINEGACKPRAIIPVDLFGLPADYESIDAIAKQYNLVVIEDAAQSFGAEYYGKKACGFGHIGTTSFFPAKPLGCYGDGGAIFTNDEKLVERLRSIRVHGMGQDKYTNVRIGLNARLDTIQAAILLKKLAIFPAELEGRQRVADRYSELLNDVVTVPHIPTGLRSAWAQYSILSDGRKQIQAELKQHGIPTAIYYPVPLHLQEAFQNLSYKAGDFPISEKLAQSIVSLPMHPYLTDVQILEITRAVRDSINP